MLKWRDLLYPQRGADHHRTVAEPLQYEKTTFSIGLQAPSTGGHRAWTIIYPCTNIHTGPVGGAGSNLLFQLDSQCNPSSTLPVVLLSNLSRAEPSNENGIHHRTSTHKLSPFPLEKFSLPELSLRYLTHKYLQ